MTPHFHPLPVAAVTQETADAISITFAVPDALRETYRYAHGQFLTLRAAPDGEELRRSYSICSTVQDYARTQRIRVAVKRVDGGRFSGWLCANAARLTTIDVLPPDGRFTCTLDAAHRKHYLGVAAGSGITPLLAIIGTVLEAEPASRFTLIYGNRDVASILFCDELEDLKDRHLQRLTLHHVLSRQHQEVELYNGRIDAAKLQQFLGTLVPAATIDEAFVCGPAGMLEAAEQALLQAGLAHAQVHVERFGTPAAPRAAAAPPAATAAAADGCALTVILDGKRTQLALPGDARVLDTALAAGLDLPYSCKSGVCCTCRAKLLEGSVAMERNFTLEPWEIERGFVLTCQARATSPRVVVSYDER
jgi:ring-1,2-phenylacetyl-CoA epoxidase subunit PaaE